METRPRVARGSHICCLMASTQTGRAGNRSGSPSYGWTHRHLKEVFTHLLPTWSHEPAHPHAPRPAAAGRRESRGGGCSCPGSCGHLAWPAWPCWTGASGHGTVPPCAGPGKGTCPSLPQAASRMPMSTACTPTPQKQPWPGGRGTAPAAVKGQSSISEDWVRTRSHRHRVSSSGSGRRPHWCVCKPIAEAPGWLASLGISAHHLQASGTRHGHDVNSCLISRLKYRFQCALGLLLGTWAFIISDRPILDYILWHVLMPAPPPCGAVIML